MASQEKSDDVLTLQIVTAMLKKTQPFERAAFTKWLEKRQYSESQIMQIENRLDIAGMHLQLFRLGDKAFSAMQTPEEMKAAITRLKRNEDFKRFVKKQAVDFDLAFEEILAFVHFQAMLPIWNG
ncbi:hypothetical protein HMP0721_0365 [Pseudoramibacter alactolyticus ATCC 23263]|uniref:Uncharacterized protein n=1 Tax=Pseudoramibacter alactolyticus ATCC 23263 TaxID=887929 RepID=E6MED2_9FIRM|nr:hypothetical protein [Pseudoramibacter alactolyticus]EFV02457.1 hypothetical protein HMP0721_0365 [Pseudoramibacter alactolyticus ATCC 23263]